jgi:hypothetical protein
LPRFRAQRRRLALTRSPRAAPHTHATQVIASTGVKGTRASEGVPGSGIAGAFALTELQDGLLYSAFMARAARTTHT